MAEIPVRSYLHEIEKHIESGRTDQAISHSRYLLQIYPKFVDAYRLLGKAYLENQRYTDAGDILQRVLSSIPDDFVANVGMSIIREDEGNMDEAIWHMERGFEVQPSNNAIQEELRRLYGKRDKVEPPKIRLTRGALARLYYKGELFQQAIGEIRAALSENPSRLDLQALLAEIYLRTNQKVEAADTALAVLHRLPNCLLAIKVMIQVLVGADRETELKSYRQLLAQLDPYSAYASLSDLNSEEVPDEAIRVEKLDWKADQIISDASTPAWAASLGVDLAELAPSTESTLPDWLDDLSAQSDQGKTAEGESTAAFPFGDFPGETQPESAIPEQPPEEEIPNWLREAGWQPSAGEGSTQLFGSQYEEVEELLESQDQIEAAEIPDWLQAMKPPVEEAAEEVQEEPQEEDVTPWLDKLLPQEPAPIEPEAAGAELEAGSLASLDESFEIETPPESAETEQPVEAFRFEEAAEALPSWMEEEPELAEPEELSFETAEPAAGETALWSEESESPFEELEAEPESALSAEPAENLPDWLAEIKLEGQEIEPEAASAEELAEALPAAEIPDWLGEALPEEFAEPKSEIETETPEETLEEGPAVLPDWLLETQGEPEGTEEPVEIEALEGKPEPATDLELPDWLMETEAAPEAEEPAYDFPEQSLEPSGEADLPAWLYETRLEAEEARASKTEPEMELPDWLKAEAETQMEETAPGGLFEEALEETLPEMEPEMELPDWLKAEAETQMEETAPGGLSEEALEETLPEMEPAESGLADWLTEPAGEVAEPEAEGEPSTEAELPEWLFESQDLEFSAEPQPEMKGFEEMEEAGSEIPDWLRETGAEFQDLPAGEPALEEIPEPEPASEIPSWLLDAQETEEILRAEGKDETLAEQPFFDEGPIVPEAALGDTQPTKIGKAAEPEPVVMEEAGFEPEAEPAPSQELEEAFAWLKSLEASGEPEELEELEAAEPTEEVFSAAQVFEAEIEEFLQPMEETPEPAPTEAEAAYDTWQADSEVEVIEPAAPAPEKPEERKEEPAQIGMDEELIDHDAAFAWLESLAVKQGASEALLLTPEERSESMPEWVKRDALAAEAAELTPSAEETPGPESEAEQEAAEMELGEQAAEETSLQPEANESEAFIMEQVSEETEAPAEPETETAFSEAPVFEEAETAASEQFEPAAEETEEDIGAWIEEEPPTEETISAEQAAPTEEGIPELPDWLAETAVSPRDELDWTPPTIPHREYDLNEASLKELERIPGIGFVRAQNIINYREEHGPFASVDDLTQVPEINADVLESARDFLVVKAVEPPQEPFAPESFPSEEETPAFPETAEASAALLTAREALTQGNLETAIEQYAALIQNHQELPMVAQDLSEASYRFSESVDVWQNLGDAYLRLDQVQEALEAYTKAEQLLLQSRS